MIMLYQISVLVLTTLLCYTDACDMVVGNTLASPNYPYKYGSNIDKCWTIVADPGNTVQIRLDGFSFEDGYDFLKIYDGSSVSDGSIDELTGTYLNSMKYESTGRFLTLHMLSDSSVGKSGFFAEIEGCIGKRPVPGNPNAYQIVRPTVMKCPHGLVFNKEICACDWAVAGTFNVTTEEDTCLIANFTFEDTLLSTINGISADPYGGPEFTSNSGSRVVRFDGVDDTLKIEYFNNWFGTPDQEFSLSVWLNPDAITNYNFVHGIISNGDCVDGSSISLHQCGDDTISSSINGDQSQCAYAYTDFTSGGWHHVAMVYDGEYLQTFVNAVQVISQFGGAPIENRHCALNIGHEVLLGELHYYKGLMGNLKIYRCALKLDEIEAEFLSNDLHYEVTKQTYMY